MVPVSFGQTTYRITRTDKPLEEQKAAYNVALFRLMQGDTVQVKRPPMTKATGYPKYEGPKQNGAWEVQADGPLDPPTDTVEVTPRKAKQQLDFLWRSTFRK